MYVNCSRIVQNNGWIHELIILSTLALSPIVTSEASSSFVIRKNGEYLLCRRV